MPEIRVDSLPTGAQVRPPKRADVLDVNDLSGGSGGGSVAVENQGTLLTAQANTINFVGTGVDAQLVSAGVVNVYIPPPAYVSHFNTTDGSDDATVSDASTSSRHVSAPTSEGNPFKIGDWTVGALEPTLRDTLLTYVPAGLFSLSSAATTMSAYVLDADGSTIVASNVQVVSGNLDVTSGGVRIAVTNFATNSNKFKADLLVSFNLSTILSSGGRFSISIVHSNGVDGTFTFSQADMFRDPDNVVAAIAGAVSITENVPVTKRLSGAYFYKEGSTFSLSVAQINNLNNISYPTTQVTVDGSGYALPALSLPGSGLSGWTSAYNDTNDSYSLSAWTIATLNYFAVTTTAHVSATPQDWTAGTTVNSSNAAVAIDTFQANETNKSEDFRDENDRLKTDLATFWDSTQSLSSYDSGVGLQVYGSRLWYPQLNFSLYRPFPGSQPNYSALSGAKTYYRVFSDSTSISHSNGTFLLSDFNLTEVNIASDDVRLEISLDGTNWYNMNLDYLGGPLSNGDGCRISPDTNALNLNSSIQFTFGAGQFTTASTAGGWGFFLRITYSGSVASKAVYIGSLTLTDWN